MTSINVENLTKNFGPVEAVKEVSLDVRDGEFVVLLGPSGSGKSTLLRCIAGLEAPSAGRVTMGGKDMAGVATRDRDVSMVFQNYALFPLMSVFDNIAFPLKVRRTPPAMVKKEVTEVAEKVGIGGLLSRTPKQLSGGEQQRVAIARAVVRKTNAVLMDEPLSNLDAPLRAQLRVELKSLQRQLGATIVYVTHDQHEAMTLADRIGVLRAGRLVQHDEPSRLYQSPSSSFVAGFVGSPAASLLKLKVTASGSEVYLEGPEIRLAPPEGKVMALRGLVGKDVVLAVRAEGVSISKSPTKGAMGVEVELLEPLGGSTIVDLRSAAGSLKAVVPGTPSMRVGERIWATLDFGRTTLFDAETDRPI